MIQNEHDFQPFSRFSLCYKNKIGLEPRPPLNIANSLHLKEEMKERINDEHAYEAAKMFNYSVIVFQLVKVTQIVNLTLPTQSTWGHLHIHMYIMNVLQHGQQNSFLCCSIVLNCSIPRLQFLNIAEVHFKRDRVFCLVWQSQHPRVLEGFNL